ncbi:hypothetical protein LTR41_011592 [Exophiala xenobiotica]|nr:hypothetical protein LTR41_011592 [Exophiala xenobiotica]KAK5550732.1 hypothetical protein LTR46_011270 [Exophiala xenobiotica]
MSKAFQQGAKAGTKTYNEKTSIPEHANSDVRRFQARWRGWRDWKGTLTEYEQDITKPNDKSALDARGSVGKQFTTDGVLGGLAKKIGGPLDKDGTVGKQFTEKGILGGMAQEFADVGVDGKSRVG